MFMLLARVQGKMTCYVVEGEAIITPDGGTPIFIRPGDLCVFRSGLRCTWNITSPMVKHYRVSSGTK